jgi:ferredoxin, 2Fe-2S
MAKYNVEFLDNNKTIEVDSNDFPYQDHGQPGSILDIAIKHNIELVHNCGGVGACATCHVIIEKGSENLSEMTDKEEDKLDLADGVTLNSRLGCLAVVKGDVSVKVVK